MMKTSFAAFFQHRIALAVRGPLLTLLGILVLQIFFESPFRDYAPFPIALLSITVIYSVFTSGVFSGLVSSTMTCVHLYFFLIESGAFVRGPEDAWNRMISWTAAFPVIVLIVGVLKRRSNSWVGLKLSEKRLQNLFEAIPHLVWTANADGAVESVNERWTSYTGMTSEQSLDWGWVSAIHPDDVSSLKSEWRHRLDDGLSLDFEFRLRATDGTYRWFWGQAARVTDSGLRATRWISTITDIEPRKQAELELLTEKNRSELLIRNIDAVVLSIDINGFFTFSDGQGLKAVGLQPGERVGMNIFEIHKDNPMVIEGVRSALRGEEWQSVYEFQGVSFESHFAPVRSALGEVVGMSGFSIDVTERIASEKANAELRARDKASVLVRLSEAKFKGAFENSPLGIGLSTPDGRWFDVNPAFCKTLGYSRDEFLQRTVDEITLPADLAIGRSYRRELIEGSVETLSFETRYSHSDGHEVPVWIHATVIRDAVGQPEYILMQNTDMTDKIRAQKRLEAATQKIQTLISSSPVAIIALDENGCLTVWNAACERMFGWKATEVLGKLLPFVPEERRSESLHIVERIHRTREPVFIEADRRRKDGTELRVAISAMPLFDESGEADGLMAVLSDITERVRFEQNIMETNRALEAATRAKSEFLANMSHEIRTPMNGVIGMTGLLLDTALTSEQNEYAETIRSSADSLLTLINDILDFSKIEAGKIEIENIQFDMEQLVGNIERTLSVTAGKKGIKLLKSVSPSLRSPRWKGDPTRIGQILLNLANNAIKFTSEGHVSLEVSQIADLGATTVLRFEINDTGIGIPEDAVPKLFQAFSQADASTTRRFGGTGLGLSISKKLVNLMNGEIGVTSAVGKGSCFWFTLSLEPIHQAKMIELRETNAENLAKTWVGKTPRILLAEDNVVNQKIAVRMIEKMGLRVDVVANGAEALSALATIPYDLILMDCQMPEVDGFEATRRLRAGEIQGCEKIPIVAMTANAMTGDREKCLDSGMDDYVSKPVNTDDLYQAVLRNLGQLAA